MDILSFKEKSVSTKKMPSRVKNIDVSNGKYIEPIVSMIQEYELVKETLWNIFERFMNEHNSNEYQDCLESLEEYRYIKSDYSIPEGRFVRYLDISKPQKMTLKQGGFVIEDLGYNVKLKSVVPPRIFNVSRNNSLFFMKINDNEKLRFACESTLGETK